MDAIDLDALERAALAAGGEQWFDDGAGTIWLAPADPAAGPSDPGSAALEVYLRDDGLSEARQSFLSAANPAVVLELVRRLRAAVENYRAAALRANANAEMLKATEAELSVSRINDRQAMAYLQEIRSAAGHDGDFPSLVDAIGQQRDMLDDATLLLELLREELGVPKEPHQSLQDRMQEAARHQRDARIAAQAEVQRLQAERNSIGVTVMRALNGLVHAQHPMAGVLRLVREAGKDAARYRWLRAYRPGLLLDMLSDSPLPSEQYAADLDETVDLAMGAELSEGEVDALIGADDHTSPAPASGAQEQ